MREILKVVQIIAQMVVLAIQDSIIVITTKDKEVKIEIKIDLNAEIKVLKELDMNQIKITLADPHLFQI